MHTYQENFFLLFVELLKHKNQKLIYYIHVDRKKNNRKKFIVVLIDCNLRNLNICLIHFFSIH